MPCVMRCRQFQWNDRSKGIGFMWTLVGEDDAVSPSKSHFAKGTTMLVPSTNLTMTSAVVSMISSPHTCVCGATEPDSVWAGTGSRTSTRAASPTHQPHGQARRRFRQGTIRSTDEAGTNHQATA